MLVNILPWVRVCFCTLASDTCYFGKLCIKSMISHEMRWFQLRYASINQYKQQYVLIGWTTGPLVNNWWMGDSQSCLSILPWNLWHVLLYLSVYYHTNTHNSPWVKTVKEAGTDIIFFFEVRVIFTCPKWRFMCPNFLGSQINRILYSYNCLALKRV